MDKLPQENLIGDAQVVATVGGQWGDEGKGKVVDWFALIFDAVNRTGGGNNAGHTIYIGDKKTIFHLVPSAALHPGKTTMVGNGVVDDPLIHLKEIEQLKAAGIDMGSHYVSGNAHVILPQHKLADLLEEVAKGSSKCGTTGRGIGPCYESKARRTGIRINDLFAPDLEEKIARDIAMWMPLFREVADKHKDIVNIKQLLHAENQMNGEFYSEADILNVRSIVAAYRTLGERILPHVTDTVALTNDLIAQGKRIMLEGAQGAELDIDHGTYPYVTSSNPTIGGLYSGTGVNKIDMVFSIMKAYVTRVGAGPHPTELADYDKLKAAIDEFRKEHGQKVELALTPEEEATIRDNKASDDLIGKALMVWGGEYGATTGRPRRCGWFDAVQARHVARLNGNKIILTKPDVLSGLPMLMICDEYAYNGPDRMYNGKLLKGGARFRDFPTDAGVLEHCSPVRYEYIDGWMKDISKLTDWSQLPENAKKYFKTIEALTGIEICAVSNGPRRDQMLL